MYGVSKTPPRIEALDPARKQWVWSYDIEAFSSSGILAYGHGFLFHTSEDGELVALHAKTGIRVWKSPRPVIASFGTIELHDGVLFAREPAQLVVLCFDQGS